MSEHGIVRPEEFTDTALERMSHLNHSFLGGGMSQSYTAVYFLEYYIRSKQFDYVVELGTGKGTLSLYLANLAACTDQFRFETYDHCWDEFYNRKENGVGHWFTEIVKVKRNVQAYMTNIFSQDMINEIGGKIATFQKSLVLCDNGNKPREVEIFSRYLKPEDRIMAHDWESEIFPHNLNLNIVDYDQPFHRYSQVLKTHWCVLKKK